MSILSRVTVGFAGLAMLGLGGYAAAFIPSPVSTGVAPLTTTVAPESVTRTIVCSGDVVGHLGDSADISTIARVQRGATMGDESNDLAMGDTTNGSVIRHAGDSARVAASESVAVRGEAVAGYLATECGDPLNDQWLLGGSATTGRDTILTISNGSDVDARVDLELWGSTGVIDAPGSRGIVVPAGSQRSYSVAGFAPDEPSPAIHLTSNGAAVWATLQTTAVRGLVPGGLDRVGPIAAATSDAYFPVLRIPDEEALGEVLADPSYADVTAALRFLVPGETDSVVTITLDPLAEGDSQVVTATIAAGATLDIPLADLAPGDWSVSVSSEQPLVAAARVGFHDPKSGSTDVAWMSAAPAQTGTATVFVSAPATLGLTNSNAEDATVSVQQGDVVTDVTVAAHSSVSVPVDTGLVVVSSTTPVAAGVFVQASDGIATLRALTAPVDAANVVVIFG